MKISNKPKPMKEDLFVPVAGRWQVFEYVCWRRFPLITSWLNIELLGTSIVSMETILTVSTAFARTKKSNFLWDSCDT